MSIVARFVGCCLAAGMVWDAGAAPAEQWLQYSSASEDSTSRWFETSTNPPPNVALPQTEANPLFIRWTTPLDPAGGRWLCLDRARPTSPPNRVWFDSNGNGRLDDETPVPAQNVSTTSARFNGLRFVFRGEEGPLVYHLALRCIRYPSGEIRALGSSGCHYAGVVDFGDKKRKVRLLDGNINGTFNDRAADPKEADQIVLIEDDVGERFVGQYLELDGRLFKLDVAADGAFVKVEPARDVPTGQVRVPDAVAEIVAVGKAGHFVRRPTRGEFTLPVGEYRVHGWKINRKDDTGQTWSASGSNFGALALFEVAGSQPATLTIGEPILAALSATQRKGSVTFGLRLKGQLGETVEILRGTQQPRAPRLLLEALGSSYRATNSFEYG